MIFYCTHGLVPSPVIIKEAFHPATDGSRCRVPQPENRQSLGSPVGEEEELGEPEVSKNMAHRNN